MGSNQIMNCYSTMFLNLEYINSYRIFKRNLRKNTENIVHDNDDACNYGPEHMIRDLMDLFHIQKKHFNINGRLI